MGVIEFYFEMNNKNPKILKLLEFYFNGYNKNDLTLKSFLAIRNYGVDVKIYKVSVKVLCYAKYDSYHQITNVDSWSHFYINEQFVFL